MSLCCYKMVASVLVSVYCFHDVQGDWSPDPWWLGDSVGFLYLFQNLLKMWGKLLVKDCMLSSGCVHIEDG